MMAGGLALVAGGVLAWWMARAHLPGGVEERRRPKGVLTFNHDIAPLMFARCAPCHRPGQSAPFSLLTYADAKKRAMTILEVTSQRLMPPWLPDGPMGQFVDDRRLTGEEMDWLRQWVQGGTPEGDAADLPRTPEFPADWPLGKPDLEVSLSDAYEMAPDGPNIYRNFVVPMGLHEQHYVRAVDCRPGSAAVHHVLIALDRSGTARRWDAKDAGPGFAGFTLPPDLEMPPHFLFWHPGKRVAEVQPGLAWELKAETDLVLQLHLRPTGKREVVAPRVAFYFTREHPTNEPVKFSLTTLKIAIPGGATNHVVRSSLMLPGDSDLLAIAPHAHFLAREITVRAKLPGEKPRVLLHVPAWNFDWQDYYRYAQPVFLAAGTMLEMEVAYDNSAGNPRNPNSPPQLVRYGLDSSDEMATVSLQILPRNEEAAKRVNVSLLEDVARGNLEYNLYLLERDPKNARAHLGLARALYQTGQLEAATTHVATARRLDPLDDDAAMVDGLVWHLRKQPTAERAAFEDCLRLNPDHLRAHGCLAMLCLDEGRIEEAELHLREVLRLDPNDADAKDSLRQIAQARARGVR